MSPYLHRIHHWIADPPDGVSDRERPSYAMVHYACVLGFLTHAAWIAMFSALGETFLAAVNVGSVALFVVALFALRRGWVFASLGLVSIEVIAHGAVATLRLGWDAQFQLYLTLLVFIWLLVRGLSGAQRTVALTTPVLCYGLLYGYSGQAAELLQPSAMASEVLELLARMNIAVAVTVVVGVYAYFVTSVGSAWNDGSSQDKGFDRILNLGVRGANESESRRIRTVNFIATCAAGIAVFYTVSFTLLGWPYAAAFNSVTTACYAGTLLLSMTMRNRAAGIYMLCVGAVHLATLPLLLLSPYAGVQYWLLVIPVFSVAVIRADDWRWVWVMTVVSLGLLGLVEGTAGLIDSPWRAETGAGVDTGLRVGSAVLTGLLIMLVASLVHVDVRRSREKLATLNARLSERLDKEQEVNRAKSGFLAQMSHELRTPLNGILGTCEALADSVYGALQPKQLQALSNIDRAGRHQLALVNDLLDLSKIEAGGFAPECERVSLVEVCTDVTQLMRGQAKLNGLRLGLSMDGEVDEIHSDTRRVRQIILNLVGNAVKFTPEGGRVGIDLEAKDGCGCVTVWDTGIGIPTEELPRMFEVFTQFDSELSRRHTGSGLGLNLSLRLAELLGGRIEVESERGVGSRFSLWLPLGTAPAAPVQPEPDWAQGTVPPDEMLTLPGSLSEALGGSVSSADSAPPQGTAVGAGFRVLLVDDTPENIGHLRDFLESKGHHVSTAANGLEAIEQAQSLPDIVFMDVQMPEMDGLEATRRLRADPKTKGLRIVALTSFAMGEDRDRCLDAGVDDYQTKPVSLRRVLQLVEASGDGGGADAEPEPQ